MNSSTDQEEIDSAHQHETSPATENGSPIAFSAGVFTIFSRRMTIWAVLLVTSIVIARALGPTNMGLWAVLLLVPSYATLLGRPQIDTASVHFISGRIYRSGEVAFVLLLVSLTITVVLGIIFLALQGWLFATLLSDFDSDRNLVYLLALTVPLSFFAQNYINLLLAREDVGGFTTLNLIRSLVGPVVGSALILVLGAELRYLAWSTLGGLAIAVLYGILREHRSEGLRPTFQLPIYRDMLSFGLKLYIGSVIGFLNTRFSAVVVVWYLTTDEVAFHQIALARALILGQIAAAAGVLLYPRIASMKEQPVEAVALTARAMRTTLLLMTVAGAVVMLFAWPGVLFLYGRPYLGVVIPFVVMVPAVVAQGATGMIERFFLARGKVWTSVALSTVALVPQIALLWFIVPRWGVPGAAAATAGALLLRSVARIAVFVITEDVPLRDTVVVRRSDAVAVFRFGIDRLKAAQNTVLRK
jgi:O-antigen/teichoic acid export membrane protein